MAHRAPSIWVASVYDHPPWPHLLALILAPVWVGPWDNPQGLFILAVPANLRFSEVEALGLESSEVGMWLMGCAGVAGEWC